MKDLITKAESYLSPDKVDFVKKAYEYAAHAHEGQVRLSGGPYIQHPMETAIYLADLHLDATTLAGALLHDVMEDCGVSREQLDEEFGTEVANLVDGVTKLNQLDMMALESNDHSPLRSEDDQNQAASLRKMLLAMAQDLRVVLIKLADRLHNMRTLRAQPLNRRLAIAQETLDIYAPLAHRLGMWDIKWRLEDMAFRHLRPARYREISRLLARSRDDRERYISHVKDSLSQALKSNGIKAQVTGRAKHIYSIHIKMEAYAALGKDFHEIFDLFALRVLVNANSECYATLGIVHFLWNPLPGQFDDYVAKPKENMYQSLHTTVMGPEGMPLEVQIRSHSMHQVSEYGVASHWLYKEGQAQGSPFEQKMNWMRQLLDWQRDVSGVEEFLENVKTDLFPDQVFVYTPKGDVKELPAGSTPIDFAYHVHTELGHRCIASKVNGKQVSLDYQLQNGDTVEIMTTKVARGPSLDWLNPHAGYVKSATARQRIRLWFRKQERGPNIQRGRDLLSRELRRLNVNPDKEELARLFRMDTVDEFLAALGSGNITVNHVMARLTQQSEEQDTVVTAPILPIGPAQDIAVLGVGGLLTHVAQCCSPLPGDPIIGFITRNRGITVHTKSCRNVVNEDESERLIQVDWTTMKRLHPVRLTIEAWDRVGLLRDITGLVSAEKVNIASLETRETDEGLAITELTLFTTGADQLSRLFTKLEEVQSVISVIRINIALPTGRPESEHQRTTRKVTIQER
jgi:guanosine-3',5'-bis(diphosphate) 3'-pyrophosphohydrolase